MKKAIFVADVGQGKVHIYDSQSDKFYPKLPEEDLINLSIPGIKSGDILIVECAHLRESHKMTMAQPYNWEDLVKLKENAKEKGIKILLFPQKSTPKARKLDGVDETQKSDKADTKAIANFLLKDTRAFNALKEFVPTRLTDFQSKNDFIFEYIKQSNSDINEAKTAGYGFNKNNNYEDCVSKWIKKYTLKIVEYLGDDELISAIGIKYTKKGYRVDKENRIYTLVHSILRPNGEIRVRKDVNKLPNWKFIKANYLGCKPYHMNQGVAASNYKHWMRRAVSEYAFPGKKSAHTTDFQIAMSFEQLEKLKEARTKVDKMTQQIWYVLREMIIEDKLR